MLLTFDAERGSICVVSSWRIAMKTYTVRVRFDDGSVKFIIVLACNELQAEEFISSHFAGVRLAGVVG